jgi:NAD(P)-dependent dehydrogenase (short-subunit alcohol dehydrogenase family)
MAKIWFLTGASSGFGQAFTDAILAKGDKVAATFRKREQAEMFTESHKSRGLGLVMDVSNPHQVRSAVEGALQRFGTIDVLVNNAGYGTVGAVEEFTMEDVRRQMETNFFGAVALTKEVLPLMREQGSGHIIQMSSVAGFRSLGGFALYNASKFALEGFSEGLAYEVAPFGIRVTIVEPGPFRTEFAGGSIKTPTLRIEAYKEGPVQKMYTYIEQAHGVQEGDPRKGAQAIVDFVYGDSATLRLPLGRTALEAIKAKLAAVQRDIAANEAIALSTHFDE